VRASLGARRGRLIRQLLTESLVLAIPGGLLGVLLAWVSLDLIVANIPLSLPSNSPVTLNLKVLPATAALLVPTALLFGLAPALRLSRVRINSVLARGGRSGSSTLSRRGSQVLISIALVSAAVFRKAQVHLEKWMRLPKSALQLPILAKYGILEAECISELYQSPTSSGIGPFSCWAPARRARARCFVMPSLTHAMSTCSRRTPSES
jgi:hypothetical protein